MAGDALNPAINLEPFALGAAVEGDVVVRISVSVRVISEALNPMAEWESLVLGIAAEGETVVGVSVFS